MKKLKVAVLALTLITGFSCKKEVTSDIQNTQNTEVKESNSETSQAKCNLPSPIDYWKDNTGTNYIGNADYGVVNYNCPNCTAGQIGIDDVYGVPDRTKLIQWFDLIESGNTVSVMNFTNTEFGILQNYIDPCVLTSIANGQFRTQMHLYENVQNGGYLEFLKVYENGTLKFVFEIWLD